MKQFLVIACSLMFSIHSIASGSTVYQKNLDELTKRLEINGNDYLLIVATLDGKEFTEDGKVKMDSKSTYFEMKHRSISNPLDFTNDDRFQVIELDEKRYLIAEKEKDDFERAILTKEPFLRNQRLDRFYRRLIDTEKLAK